MSEKKEYIERGALLNILNTIYEECRLNDDGATSDLALDVIRHIEDQPAADVTEVVHGEWIAKDLIVKSPFARNYYCSVCKYEPLETKNYCPECGAKMDGDRKEL